MEDNVVSDLWHLGVKGKSQFLSKTTFLDLMASVEVSKQMLEEMTTSPKLMTVRATSFLDFEKAILTIFERAEDLKPKVLAHITQVSKPSSIKVIKIMASRSCETEKLVPSDKPKF